MERHTFGEILPLWRLFSLSRVTQGLEIPCVLSLDASRKSKDTLFFNGICDTQGHPRWSTLKTLLLLFILTAPVLAGDQQPRVVVADHFPAPGEEGSGGGALESGRSAGGEGLHVELHVPARVELSVDEEVNVEAGAEVKAATGTSKGTQTEALLRCMWRLPAGAALYSTKWYKDGHEFLRYMPAERPPLLAFPALGVNLQEGSWSPDVVALRNLSVASDGLYRCEVSTEGPAFRTAFDQQRLHVVAPPPGEPRVTGVREAYAPGETVEANCSAGRSHPPPHLTWYINGIKAERWFPGRAPAPLDSADARGLVSRTLPLRLRVERRLFLGPGRQLRLRCEATAAAAGLRWERLFTPRLLAPPAPDAPPAAASDAAVADGGPSPAARQTEPRARARQPPHDDAGNGSGGTVQLKSFARTLSSVLLSSLLAFVS